MLTGHINFYSDREIEFLNSCSIYFGGQRDLIKGREICPAVQLVSLSVISSQDSHPPLPVNI